MIATLGPGRRAREPRPGDHGAGRRHPLPEPELSDPRLRLHHFGRRHPLRAVRERDRLLRHAGARRAPQRAEADGDRGFLSLEPDGAGGGSRLLPRGDRLCRKARSLCDLGPRLFGNLFRRQPAALDPAGAGLARAHRRVHVAVEDLLDAGMADGLCGRQREAHQCAWPRQILSRLRRLHADPGGCNGGTQW